MCGERPEIEHGAVGREPRAVPAEIDRTFGAASAVTKLGRAQNPFAAGLDGKSDGRQCAQRRCRRSQLNVVKLGCAVP